MPSVTPGASLTEIRGSSSRMVPMPWPTPMVALTGALRLTAKVSVSSGSRSPVTATATVADVRPAGMVTSPEAAV